MGKRREFNITGHAHELTFSCFRSRPLLKSDFACKKLAQSMVQAREKHSFGLWAYVFMPNHVHLLIYPPKDKYYIGKILTSIKQSTARGITNYLRKYNKDLLRMMRTGRDGDSFRFWQDGGGYDRNIVSYEALINAVNYIHNNPVRKG